MKPRYPDTAEGWLTYLLRAGVSEQNSAALVSWCEEQPENRAEFELLSRGWQVASELENDMELAAALGPTVVRSPWPVRLLAAASLACLLLAAFWFLRGPQQVWRYQTSQGEQRTVALGDGSRIFLNTATTMDFDADKQRVSLLTGEAFFEVNRQKKRPFSVDAGSAMIRVLGTRFNVLREGEDLLVAVLEGRVRVDTRVGIGEDEVFQEIGAGEVLEIRTGEKRPRLHAEGSDLDRVKAWREGKIELERTPLRQAVRELSRYTPKPLKIVEPGLDELRVSGVFRIDRLGDLSSLRFALENLLPVRLKATEDALELIPSP